MGASSSLTLTGVSLGVSSISLSLGVTGVIGVGASSSLTLTGVSLGVSSIPLSLGVTGVIGVGASSSLTLTGISLGVSSISLSLGVIGVIGVGASSSLRLTGVIGLNILSDILLSECIESSTFSCLSSDIESVNLEGSFTSFFLLLFLRRLRLFGLVTTDVS